MRTADTWTWKGLQNSESAPSTVLPGGPPGLNTAQAGRPPPPTEGLVVREPPCWAQTAFLEPPCGPSPQSGPQPQNGPSEREGLPLPCPAHATSSCTDKTTSSCLPQAFPSFSVAPSPTQGRSPEDWIRGTWRPISQMGKQRPREGKGIAEVISKFVPGPRQACVSFHFILTCAHLTRQPDCGPVGPTHIEAP